VSRSDAIALESLLDPRRVRGVRPGVGSTTTSDILDLRPPADAMSARSRRLYSRIPFDHQPAADDPTAFERRLSPLARRLADVLPRTGAVLEAGCGPGHMTAWLRSHDVSVVALDQSVESLERLRARTDAAAVAADVTALPFRDQSFDAVLADGVVHHSRFPARAIAELVRVTAPGGLLFLRVYRAEARYPTLYRMVGGVLRALARTPPLDRCVWRLAFPAYRAAADARDRRRGLEPGLHDEGVFADYFLTPRATPMRGSTLLSRLRRFGLEVLAYERYRNVHGFLARRRGGSSR
jgi:SAM-dependent methyltransferase